MRGTAWLALTIPAVVLAGAGLALTVRSLLRTVRGAVVASLPITTEQTVRLGEAGSYGLYVEGRLGTRDFAYADFAMTGPAGTSIPMRPVLMRTKVTSLSGRVRLELRTFEIDGPGEFRLRVTGVGPTSDPNNRVIISRPAGALIAIHVIGLVLLGGILIGSLVGSILLLMQKTR